VNLVNGSAWEIEPIEETQVAEWANFRHTNPAIPLPPDVFCNSEEFPATVCESLLWQIVGDDTLLLRALMHFSVTRVAESQPLAKALLEIFAHVGRLNALIVTLCGLDFDNRSLEPQAVLRLNSHLTNFFKAVAVSFGGRYRQKVISKLAA
jgi:hypothetical protein